MKLANVPFKIESNLMRAGMRALRLRPGSYPFIAGDSFRVRADYTYEDGILKREKLPGARGLAPLVFVHSNELEKFLQKVSHEIGPKYVLISHSGDANIGKSQLEMLDERVVHCFTQNLMTPHEKATCIPLGLENANLHCNGIVADLVRLRKRLVRIHKMPRILNGFEVRTNPGERMEAQGALRASNVATEIDRVNSRAYHRLLAQFMFVASPPGSGFECHRTWEALYLGVVPVVKWHPFYQQFPGLPLLQVDNWKDLISYSEDQLLGIYNSLKDHLDNLPLLWMDYWQSRIESSRRGLK